LPFVRDAAGLSALSDMPPEGGLTDSTSQHAKLAGPREPCRASIENEPLGDIG